MSSIIEENRVPATRAINTDALFSMAGSIAEPASTKIKNTLNEIIENN